MKSPAQRRREAGLDVHLTPQGTSAAQRRVRRRRIAEHAAGKDQALMKNVQRMRELESKGFSAKQVETQTIVPRAGKRKGPKAGMSLRDRAEKKLRACLARKKRKASEVAEAKGEVAAEQWQDCVRAH